MPFEAGGSTTSATQMKRIFATTRPKRAVCAQPYVSGGGSGSAFPEI